jgi:hypothetical protein
VRFEISRLRGGEWIIGGASLALLISAFALPWYGIRAPYAATPASQGYPVTVDAWNSLATLRFLIVIVAIAGSLAWWLQATRRAPGLPVSATVATVVLATLLELGLIYRVLIDRPAVLLAGVAGVNIDEARVGAYAGLILTAAILFGAYLSLREDGIAPADAPQTIETLRVAPRPSAGTR